MGNINATQRAFIDAQTVFPPLINGVNKIQGDARRIIDGEPGGWVLQGLFQTDFDNHSTALLNRVVNPRYFICRICSFLGLRPGRERQDDKECKPLQGVKKRLTAQKVIHKGAPAISF